MPRIYVGTYAKYNNGSIEGAWLDLEDYACAQDFTEACLELHADEPDPELMFQDWEDIPDCFISECSIDEDFWLYMDDDHCDDEAKEAYCSCFGEWDESDFEDRYAGKFSSWEDMAKDYVESTGMLHDVPDNLKNYFDYGAFANDIRCSGEMCEENGYFFRNY